MAILVSPTYTPDCDGSTLLTCVVALIGTLATALSLAEAASMYVLFSHL